MTSSAKMIATAHLPLTAEAAETASEPAAAHSEKVTFARTIRA